MLNVFDTVGMEADNISKWQSEIDTFVESKHDKNDVIENQLHGVFYIVNAASSRIEPFEEDIIIKFSKKHNLPVTVVFTNSDNADKNQLLEMKKILSIFSPIEVCSIAVKKEVATQNNMGETKFLITLLVNLTQFLHEEL
ncbi:hypothetical protein AAEU29_10490 [Pseudoalteromonas sp. SSM20]|uniref:hypothetical protein n=1 Tax=Pseudoalteromonas sp. SSM20 TaxID=3139394 RepID=UPI003BACDA8E